MNRTITATAPIRVCDLGGWTDTWFAGHGAVLNIAVTPFAEVRLTVRPRGDDDPPVVLDAVDFGDRYAVVPGDPLPGRHPLLEAVVEEVGVPDGTCVEIRVHSDAPAGGSTGTSAAVSVALLGALDALTPGRRTPHEVARSAHRIETERLGLQSGVQDQLCAALGAVSFIEITDYPQSLVSPVRIAAATWSELERQLLLVYLGRSHTSSAVHDTVIAELHGEGPFAPRLQTLRALAVAGRDALLGADLNALGAAMSANTAVQAELHADLVGPDARQLIELARGQGALGWKVNGAGGDGGSVTVLCGRAGREQLVRELQRCSPELRVVPTRLSRFGLQVSEAPARPPRPPATTFGGDER